MSAIGIIIIGRNEGPRLPACLASTRKAGTAAALLEIVYVDSHSTDDSLQIAQNFGAHTVLLDPSQPFSAARARNAGAQALLERHPSTSYLQFLDGDTELNATWLPHAAAYLDVHPPVAVVAGRVRERHPEATLYNLLGDMEWDTPVGEAHEFGGIFMIRAAAFQQLHGFNPAFIAGEEPDLALRLRHAGHHIRRLNHDMVLHDLAITRFSQWWRRTLRSGHAVAQLARAHGGPPFFFYKKQWRSTLFWTLAVPIIILLLALIVSPWLLFLFPCAYVFLAGRIMRYRLRRGDDRTSAFLYGLFTTLGKFPQLLGMVKFYRALWPPARPPALIEYKTAAPSSPSAANPTPAPIGNT